VFARSLPDDGIPDPELLQELGLSIDYAARVLTGWGHAQSYALGGLCGLDPSMVELAGIDEDGDYLYCAKRDPASESLADHLVRLMSGRIPAW